MKIESARVNNHRRAFELVTARGTFSFPYAKAEPIPTPGDPIVEMFLDPETGKESITYRLASGEEGFVHIEQALDYNREPAYMRDLFLYLLTVEATKRMAMTRLSRREIIRRLHTSPAQLYRLLDATNYTKSVDSMLRLLWALDCEVEILVKDRLVSAQPGQSGVAPDSASAVATGASAGIGTWEAYAQSCAGTPASE
jgi:hypothetical protein